MNCQVHCREFKSRGAIVIGHRESSIPFSYFDNNDMVVGYAMDLCYRIAAAVKSRLDMPNLQIKLAPVTPANRIQSILSGAIDLECGSTSNNVERQKIVAFSVTYFVAANRILSKKVSGVQTLEDLRGKTVVSTIGTANLKEISDLNAQRHLELTIIAAKDHSEAFNMVETNRAAAFVMDDILLNGLLANSPSSADYVISADALSVQPYGVMMRRNDPEFKKLVDDAIIGIFRSGQLQPIYAKWFQSPIPPSGMNLNLPMSEQLKHAVAAPTDSGDPADYIVNAATR